MLFLLLCFAWIILSRSANLPHCTTNYKLLTAIVISASWLDHSELNSASISRLFCLFFLLSCGPVATQCNATQHDMQSARALSPVLKHSRMQMTLFEFTWPLSVRNPTCVGGIVKPTRFFWWRHFAKRHSEEGRGRCMKMKACMPFSSLSQFWHPFTWNLEVSSICRQRIKAAR